MYYFYEVEVKQLIAPNGNWEVVYNDAEGEFTLDVIYFAVCDLHALPYIDQKLRGNEDCLGVILPVVACDDEGLSVEIVSYYREPNEQKTRVRLKDGDATE